MRSHRCCCFDCCGGSPAHAMRGSRAFCRRRLASGARCARQIHARCRRAPGTAQIGTLSVYALLIVLAVQVSTGVFTNDGSFTEGPWVKFVSEAPQQSSIHNSLLQPLADSRPDRAARGCDRVLLARSQRRLAHADADGRQARNRRTRQPKTARRSEFAPRCLRRSPAASSFYLVTL